MPGEFQEYNFLVVGASKIGKTALLKRFQYGSFSDQHTPTLGADFSVSKLGLSGGKVPVKLKFIDMAGNEEVVSSESLTKSAPSRDHALLSQYHAILIVYDVTNRASFNRAQALFNHYRGRDAVIAFFGNKSGESQSQDVVTREKVSAFTQKNSEIQFSERGSVKKNVNVKTFITQIARACVRKFSPSSEIDDEDPNQIQGQDIGGKVSAHEAMHPQCTNSALAHEYFHNGGNPFRAVGFFFRNVEENKAMLKLRAEQNQNGASQRTLSHFGLT